MVQLSHLYMTTGKTIALTIGTLVGKVMSLLFNTLSRFVIAFLSRSKCLLNSWLQSPSAVILEPKKIKSVPASTFPPSICNEVMGPDTMILVFWMLSLMPAFSLSSFTFIKRLFSSLWGYKRHFASKWEGRGGARAWWSLRPSRPVQGTKVLLTFTCTGYLLAQPLPSSSFFPLDSPGMTKCALLSRTGHTSCWSWRVWSWRLALTWHSLLSASVGLFVLVLLSHPLCPFFLSPWLPALWTPDANLSKKDDSFTESD